MNVIHEYDCDFQILGVCTCGAFLRVSRSGSCPGLPKHAANLKKLRELLEREKAPAAGARPDLRVCCDEQTPPAG